MAAKTTKAKKPARRAATKPKVSRPAKSTPRAKAKVVKAARAKPAKPPDKPYTRAAQIRATELLIRYRERQRSVARILEHTFGSFAKQQPELWEQRAYMLLVGIVYDRLASGEAGLKTRELAALAKTFHEIELSRQKRGSRTDRGANRPVEQESLRTAIRDIYGLSFDDNKATQKKEA